MRGLPPTRAHERELWQRGHRYVAGLDEVGRGCLAGPVTIAAVVLPDECSLEKVTDSKRLSPRQRRLAAIDIKRQAIAVGLGWASCGEIDAVGLTVAQQRAAQRALSQLRVRHDAIILDGHHDYVAAGIPTTLVVGGDHVCLAVAAASVIAKIARDQYMELVDGQFPGYGFAGHKGYGSRQHREALVRLGPTVYHRYSFQPLRQPVVS